MIKFDEKLKIFYSTLINDDNYFSGFTTKAAGDARHPKIIFDFFNNNNFPYKKIVILNQIHSTNVEIFNSMEKVNMERINETDGVITQLDRTGLTVITADCQPIIFVDKSTGIIGISHQGWRGSIKRLPQKMIKKMIELGANKKLIIANLGPAIGACCYNIDEERYYQFLEEFDGYSEKIFHRRGGKLYLNLTLLNYLQLLNEGVLKENIDFFPFCTRCDKKRFFSFRRNKKEEYGEMFSFIIKY